MSDIATTDPLDPFAQLALLRFEAKQRVHGILENLDPYLPNTLHFSVAAMLQMQFTPKQLEALLGASQTTIGRWGIAQTIPRADGYRKWCVHQIIGLLVDDIKLGPTEGTPPTRSQRVRRPESGAISTDPA